jgi:hypothetical protein
MLAASSLSDVLKRAELGGITRPLYDRLASVVFAHPGSAVIGDLNGNRLLFDGQSGEEWDLFIAGYYQYGTHGDVNPITLYRSDRSYVPWQFSPQMFVQFVRDVETSSRAWRYTGDPQVVSFMVYGGNPDWKSLHHVDLFGVDAPSIGGVIEGLRRWQVEEPDRRFAPGEALYETTFIPCGVLRDALKWAALAATAGVIGNRVDDLLGRLLS